MDGGFDSIQILVVVLVVLAQGAGAIRAWYRKQKQRREQEEARTGIPGNRGVYGSTDPQEQGRPAQAELPDWDPFEEEDEEERIPEAPRPVGSGPHPPPPKEVPSRTQAYAPAVASPVPQVLAYQPTLPLVPLPTKVPSYNKRIDRQLSLTKLPGGISLRNAILTKEILDRPLSARRLGGPSARP